MPGDLADQVLRLLADAGVVVVDQASASDQGGSDGFTINAIDRQGQRWTATAGDRYGAACALADLVGLDLE